MTYNLFGGMLNLALSIYLTHHVGRHSEYQPKGGDTLQLESKGRYGSCMGGR